MKNRAVSTMIPVATPQASASGSVTFGSVRSVGGTRPVTFFHAAASPLRSSSSPPVVAIVVISVVEPPAPSLFLLIRSLLAPLRNCAIIPRIPARRSARPAASLLSRPHAPASRPVAAARRSGCLVEISQ